MTDTDDAPAPAKKSAFAGLKKPVFALGILVIVWFVFGQVVPRAMFSAKSGQPVKTAAINDEQAAEIDALNARLLQLEAKLKTFEDVITALPPPPPPPPAADMQWQASIEEKIVQLEQRPTADRAAGDERIAALEARINNQQQSFATLQMQADSKLAMLTAFNQLKEAVQRGTPFADSHAALVNLAQGRAEALTILEKIAPYAPQGIITTPFAAAEFPKLVPLALAPESSGTLKSNLRSLITVRKVGEAPGNDDEAVLARAESKLARDDMAGALTELSQLSAHAAGVFSGWVKAAQGALLVREALGPLQLALAQEPASP